MEVKVSKHFQNFTSISQTFTFHFRIFTNTVHY